MENAGLRQTCVLPKTLSSKNIKIVCGTIMNINVCVCLWMGGQRGELISGILPKCPEDISCLFWCEDHTRSYAHENL